MRGRSGAAMVTLSLDSSLILRVLQDGVRQHRMSAGEPALTELTCW